MSKRVKAALILPLVALPLVSWLVVRYQRSGLEITVEPRSERVALVTAKNLHRNFVQGGVYVDAKTDTGWAGVPGPSMIISIEAGGTSGVPVDVPDSDIWRVRIGYVETETLQRRILLKHGVRLHRLKLDWLRRQIERGMEKESHEQIGPEIHQKFPALTERQSLD